MAHLDWSSTADSDPAQSAETRRELFSRFADTPTLVIGGHFNAGHIKRDGDAFKFMALLRLGSAAEDERAQRLTRARCSSGQASGRGARGALPCYPAQSAVEFPRALFQEAFKVHHENRNQGVMKMKLVRYGAKGAGKARPDR